MEKREIYPLELKIRGDIEDGMTLSTTSESLLIGSFGAIEIEIKINSNDYPKESVYKAVKETAMRAAEYFH